MNEDTSDIEEEALVADYREQVAYDESGLQDVDRPSSIGLGDIQAQLVAAAAPLDYSATLETKIASYE
jgi:translation initiation factor 3 subunit L